jgi:hypothetical protein
MAQEAPAPEGEKPAAEKTPDAPKPEDKPQDGPQTFDAEYVKTLRAEAAERRVEVQQLKEQLEERDEKEKSELERAQGKATKAEQARLEAESKLLRFEVAAEKQLPKELVPRLRGSSREELEADADELLNLVKSRTDTDKAPDFDGGAREPAPDADPEKAHAEQVMSLLGLARRT